MKKTFAVIAVLVVLLGGYTAWPITGLYRIASALDARNAQALDNQLDYRLLRQSLTGQIMQAYLKLTGKDQPPQTLRGQLVMGLIATVADPLVAKLINSETLLDLLGKGWPSSVVPGEPPAAIRGISRASIGNAWQIFLNSEYSGANFYATVPVASPPAEQFRLHLQLLQWKWKVVGIDLPEALRVRIAQEVIKLNPEGAR